MNKFIRIYKKYFAFDKAESQRVKTAGISMFIIKYGIIRIGMFGGIIILFASYLQDIKFKIQNASLTTFFLEYLVHVPYTILAGCFIAVVAWILSLE